MIFCRHIQNVSFEFQAIIIFIKNWSVSICWNLYLNMQYCDKKAETFPLPRQIVTFIDSWNQNSQHLPFIIESFVEFIIESSHLYTKIYRDIEKSWNKNCV